MITLLALTVLLHQDATAQLRNVIGKPTGRNGYEEYVQACIELKAPSYDAAYQLVVKSPPGSDTFLSSRIAAANLGLKAKTLVLSGNAKPVFRPGAMSLDTLFPELASFKAVARYLAIQAAKEFADGRYNEAGETLTASLAYADKVTGSGVLISYLVGLATLSTVLATVDQNLQLISVPSWRRIIKQCDEMLVSTALLDTIRREMDFAASSAIEIAEHPDMLISSDEMSPEEQDQVDRLKALTPQQKTQFAADVRIRLQESFSKIKEALSKTESNWPTEIARIESQLQTDNPSLAAMMVSIMTPVYGQVVNSSLRTRAQIRLLKLNGLIQIYRWETGKLPATLDALGRPDAVVDPLSGDKFQYEVIDDSYDLYSKGTNAMGRVGLIYKRPPGPDDDVTPP